MSTIETSALTEQYRILTEGCGLVDRSERGKLALTGGDAVEFLNGQITNDVTTLRPGEGCYAAFLTHKGKMLGDLRVLAVGEPHATSTDAPPSELLLDTERVALQALFDTIRRFSIGYDVQLHKRTLEHTLLSLVGPHAGTVAAQAASGRDLEGDVQLPTAEHAHSAIRIQGMPARLIKTDVGLDVLCESSHRDAIAEALQAAGSEAVSEASSEIVRVEHGRPRYGIDLDDTTIPQEGGLNERAVSFTKGCYVGQETVARLYYKGKPNRLLRGLRLSQPFEAGAPLLLGEREVGRLTSSVLSPALGPIGLALVRVQAEPGSTLSVGGESAGAQGATAVVSELPFPAQ